MIDPVVATLAGTALGAGVGYFGQRSLWIRQEARRFDDALRLAAVQVVEAFDDIDTYAVAQANPVAIFDQKEDADRLFAALRVLSGATFNLRLAGGARFDEIGDEIARVRNRLINCCLNANDEQHVPLDVVRPEVRALENQLAEAVRTALR